MFRIKKFDGGISRDEDEDEDAEDADGGISSREREREREREWRLLFLLRKMIKSKTGFEC